MMNQETYNKPVMEIIDLRNEDVICASGDNDHEGPTSTNSPSAF